MIRIDRDRVPRPSILNIGDPNSAASQERENFIAYYRDPGVYLAQPGNSKPKHQAYSHDSVKLALFKLFHLKCAYCGVDYAAATSANIEHFRPKGRIRNPGQDVISPGYYWLAADWDNLFLSCPDCNQGKRQFTKDRSGDLVFEEVTTGKWDQFPLEDPTVQEEFFTRDFSNLTEDHVLQQCETHVNTEESGQRLLLNPCCDNPEEHLRYDKDGNIYPRSRQGRPSKHGTKSIEVYALDRYALKSARKRKCLDMISVWGDIEYIDGQLNMVDRILDAISPNDPRSATVHNKLRVDGEKLQEKTQALLAYAEEGQEFAGMARWILRSLKKRIRRVEERYARIAAHVAL